MKYPLQKIEATVPVAPESVENISRDLVALVSNSALVRDVVGSRMDDMLLAMFILRKAGLPAIALTLSLHGANDVPHRINAIRVDDFLLGMKGETEWDEIIQSYVGSFPDRFRPIVGNRIKEDVFMEDIEAQYFEGGATDPKDYARLSQWIDEQVVRIQARLLDLGTQSGLSFSYRSPRL